MYLKPYIKFFTTSNQYILANAALKGYQKVSFGVKIIFWIFI